MCIFKQISTSEGQNFAQEIGAVFSETSALTATNVEWLFIEIGQYCIYMCVCVSHTNPSILPFTQRKKITY